MKRFMQGYVRITEKVNYRIGRFAMYGIFVMLIILGWSTVTKMFLTPSIWTLEMAQFAMVAYYVLGGPYAIQLGANVRMDLVYGSWTPRRKACMTSGAPRVPSGKMITVSPLRSAARTGSSAVIAPLPERSIGMIPRRLRASQPIMPGLRKWSAAATGRTS